MRNCPLAANTSSSLLRGYFIAAMPLLRAFNEDEISSKEREEAERMYGPLVRMQMFNNTDSVQYAHQTKFPNKGVVTLAKGVKSANSLLRAHQLQTAKGNATSSANNSSGGLRRQTVLSGGNSIDVADSVPVAAPTQSVAGSTTSELLQQLQVPAGSAWCVSTGSGVSNSSTVTIGSGGAGSHYVSGVITPSGLTIRAMSRHALQAEFFAQFDAAVKKLVYDAITTET